MVTAIFKVLEHDRNRRPGPFKDPGSTDLPWYAFNGFTS